MEYMDFDFIFSHFNSSFLLAPPRSVGPRPWRCLGTRYEEEEVIQNTNNKIGWHWGRKFFSLSCSTRKAPLLLPNVCNFYHLRHRGSDDGGRNHFFLCHLRHPHLISNSEEDWYITPATLYWHPVASTSTSTSTPFPASTSTSTDTTAWVICDKFSNGLGSPSVESIGYGYG